MQFNQAKTRMPVEMKKTSFAGTRSSVYTENFKGEFYNISVDKLIPFKNQARKIFNEEGLVTLAETIKEHGIRQPLTIIASDIKEGSYEVISGERRLRAAKMIGLKQVPCIIVHDIKKAEEIALIENIQRQDLHPIELMKAFQSLIDNKICASQVEIAKKVGMPRSSVVEIMGLGALSNEVHSALIEHKISSRDFLRLLLKEKEENRLAMISRHVNPSIAMIAKRGQKKKCVLSIDYNDDKLSITKNMLNALSAEKRKELRNLLLELL